MSTGILQFTKPSYTVTEDGKFIGDSIEVSRTEGNTGIASVQVSSKNSTAKEGQDYTKISVTLTWADKEEGKK